MPKRGKIAGGISRRKFFHQSGLAIPSALVGASCDHAGYRKKDSPTQVNQAESWSRLEPWIEIDYENFGYNLNTIRRLSSVPVMAVIKAEAYGHGLINTAKYLESRNVRALMVGKLSEGIRLRKAGIGTPILNFGPFDKGDAETLVADGISQSVFTDAAAELALAAERSGKKAGVHIHIDTGMGRSGIPYPSALPFLKKISSYPSLRIEGISTTLTEDGEFDSVQIRRFLAISGEAEELGLKLGFRHAASSGGLMTMASAYLDMVRPGIALYGYYPFDASQEEDRLGLKPVLSLKSRVHAVKTLRAGESVSYHRAYKATKKERIALITLGYSDGYPPQAAARAHVLIRGQRFPVIGGITANHTEVLLGDNTSAAPGDEVVFIGQQGTEKISAYQVAKWGDTSVYKVLIGLNPLLPRRPGSEPSG